LLNLYKSFCRSNLLNVAYSYFSEFLNKYMPLVFEILVVDKKEIFLFLKHCKFNILTQICKGFMDV